MRGKRKREEKETEMVGLTVLGRLNASGRLFSITEMYQY